MAGGYTHAFTVFTATYNREPTLHRVYESLARQTFRDFEWLVVDDGSTDGTRALVDGWARTAAFPIRYLWQENQGKHVAFNRGVREARGELFLPLDSDDSCVPDALERFKSHWDAIPADQRDRFSAVTALCRDQTGRLVGTRFPFDVTDSDSLEVHYRFKVRGEKWGFHRTDVLRDHPFPELLKGELVPESIVWWRIARRRKTRFVNDVLRVYHTDQPSLLRGRGPSDHAAGRRLAHLVVLNEQGDYFRFAPLEFCRSAGQYVRCSFHVGTGVADQLAELTSIRGRVLWLLALPLGWAAYLRDRMRVRGGARRRRHRAEVTT